MNRMMSQVVGMWCGALLVLGAAGCKKEEAAPPKTEEPPVAQKPPEKPPEPPKPLTPEEMAKSYQDCWAKFNGKAWDEFKKCFADEITSDQVDSGMPTAKGPDAVLASVQMFAKAFPDGAGEAQFVLVNGHTAAGVWLVKGTNSGPMMGPDGKEMPATNKKIGVLVGHIIEANDAGKAVKEMAYIDYGTMMAQLGMNPMPARAAIDKGAASPTVVIAKDDDTEKKNLAAAKGEMDAWNKHDAKALEAFYADDAIWSEQAAAKDQSKKEMLTGLASIWKSFSDVKLSVASQWAAGDYVVTTGQFEGTNDGDMPAMKLKKTGKKVSLGYFDLARFEGGKIKESWLIYNSGAFAQQLGLAPPPGAAPAAGGKEAKEGKMEEKKEEKKEEHKKKGK